MILAAGLGTRMRPLTDYRAKPALPVQGRPVISLLLALLSQGGIREVMINLHHLPDSIREAVDRDHPEGLDIHWSHEDSPLGTGGGLRRAAAFLRQSDECLVLAGDMLLDTDLPALLDRHRASRRDVTVVLLDDPRLDEFGSIGIDSSARVVRIGETPVRIGGAGPEVARGLFTSLRIFGREALSSWPTDADQGFEDLRDWLLPRLESGALDLGGEIVSRSECVWEPVGTPAEYLRANLAPPELPRLGGSADTWRGKLSSVTEGANVVANSARIGRDARLERCVVWDDERVPTGFRASDGVFAGGAFHSCSPNTNPDGEATTAGSRA